MYCNQWQYVPYFAGTPITLPMRLLLSFSAAVLGLTTAEAAVKLHPLFADHMVLQRGVSVPVWGTASAGEKISVRFAGQTVAAVADASGFWRATLSPLSPSGQPAELVVAGGDTITVRDVVVGDVWLASGQSNMASPLSSGSAAEALPSATDKLVRFYTVTKAISATPRPEPEGRWDVSSPEAARNFSAVAYFFAVEIRRSQGVPVGILNASWGGTPIRTWMPVESLEAEPPIAGTLAEWRQALERHLAVKDKPELMTAYYADMKDWETNVDAPFRAARKAHEAAVKEAKASGKAAPAPPKPARPEPVVPDPIAMPSASKRPSTPTITYNAMIAPLAPFALKGFLWYQGEADVSRAAEYRVWFPRMIEGWRRVWSQGDLPFVFVQLPANGRDPEPVASKGLAFLREAQAEALRLPATAMAVTFDIGDPADVHPDNKVHTGRRVALAARRLAYGEAVDGASPLASGHAVEDGSIRIQFANTGGGLVAGVAPWRPKGAAVLPADRVLGFHVAGADRVWHPASARIEGDAVVVTSTAVKQPAAVRYAWTASPEANLYGSSGLPVAPFRTDAW